MYLRDLKNIPGKKVILLLDLIPTKTELMEFLCSLDEQLDRSWYKIHSNNTQLFEYFENKELTLSITHLDNYYLEIDYCYLKYYTEEKKDLYQDYETYYVNKSGEMIKEDMNTIFIDAINSLEEILKEKEYESTN